MDLETHWYCPCGTTRVTMGPDIQERMIPVFVCESCGAKVGPVSESDEVIRQAQIEDDGW